MTVAIHTDYRRTVTKRQATHTAADEDDPTHSLLQGDFRLVSTHPRCVAYLIPGFYRQPNDR